MTLTLQDFNGMELMWQQLPKAPDENHVTLAPGDVDSMWQCGLVDTKQFPIEVWRRAFDEHKRPDGKYLLSKEEFLAKESYRYKGEIMIPFDPMQINEGKYTDEGLNELFELSVVPSCSLESPKLKDFLDNLKDRFRDKKTGLIAIKADTKLRIKELIDKYPSPLRRLEIIFDCFIKDMKMPEETAASLDVEPAATEITPQQLAKIQASSFSMQPTSVAEEDWKALGAIEKRSSKKTAAAEGKTTTTIKKAKRSRKGLRG